MSAGTDRRREARASLGAGLALLLALTGCATPLEPRLRDFLERSGLARHETPEMSPAAEEELFWIFVRGRARPHCLEDCMPFLEGHRLLSQGSYRSLAVHVTDRGTDTGLMYYLLGRAAEGLDYEQTALTYYKVSRINRAEPIEPDSAYFVDLNERIGRLTGRRNLILAVQQGLKRHGYDPGPVDGAEGPRTQRAVGDFKRARRLDPDTGLVELLVHLDRELESEATPAPPGDRSPPVIATERLLQADGDFVTLEGMVTDESKIGGFSVDGESVALGDDGRFRVSRVVPLGTSYVTLSAVDVNQNRVEDRIQVVRRSRRVEPTSVARTPATPAVAAPARADRVPPRVIIPGRIDTTSDRVVLSGRVEDDSAIRSLELGGESVRVEADGRFQKSVRVALGASAIELVAEDEWGNLGRQSVEVFRTIDADFGRYHALVIGNNEYRELPDLHSAHADARAVADVLRSRYGFQVREPLLDATRSQIIEELSRLRAELTPEDNLLIYYAGHGVEDKEAEQGYWLPVDAQEGSQANWLHNVYLRDQLTAMKAKHVLVVADSCYAGRLVRSPSLPSAPTSDDKLSAWLKKMNSGHSRTVLTSGGLEPVSDDGGGEHSVFAAALLQELREARVPFDGQWLYDQIKRPVVLNADQTPQYSDIRNAGHREGDFVFVPKGQ